MLHLWGPVGRFRSRSGALGPARSAVTVPDPRPSGGARRALLGPRAAFQWRKLSISVDIIPVNGVQRFCLVTVLPAYLSTAPGPTGRGPIRSRTPVGPYRGHSGAGPRMPQNGRWWGPTVDLGPRRGIPDRRAPVDAFRARLAHAGRRALRSGRFVRSGPIWSGPGRP